MNESPPKSPQNAAGKSGSASENASVNQSEVGEILGELIEKSDSRTDVTPEAAERPSDEGTDGHLKTGNIHKVEFTDGRPDPHVHEFRHQGRSYRLIKRLPSKNAAWHIQFELNGRRIHRSLKTNNAKVAEARAVTGLIRPALREDWGFIDSRQNRKTSGPTVAEVLEIYRDKAFVHEVKPRVGKNNISMLRKILTASIDKPVEKIRLSELNAKVIREFKEHLTVARLKDQPERYHGQIKRKISISGNSMIGQARCIFSRNMLRIYNDEGISVPDSLDDFIKAPGFKKISIEYSAPSDEIIQATFKEVLGKCETDPNLFKAFWLAAGCGLRKSEIINADWGNFTSRSDRMWFITEDVGKDGLPIEVPVLSDAWKELSRIKVLSGSILEGTGREIKRHVWDRIGKWMGDLGWRSEKRIHELRAWAGSRVAQENGLTMASMFLRHKDVRTTQKHYARYLKLDSIDADLGTRPKEI